MSAPAFEIDAADALDARASLARHLGDQPGSLRQLAEVAALAAWGESDMLRLRDVRARARALAWDDCAVWIAVGLHALRPWWRRRVVAKVHAACRRHVAPGARLTVRVVRALPEIR